MNVEDQNFPPTINAVVTFQTVRREQTSDGVRYKLNLAKVNLGQEDLDAEIEGICRIPN